MLRVKAVIFDLDNTLYPYAPCHEAGLRRARRQFAVFPGALPRRFDAAYLKARSRVAQRHRGTAHAHNRLLYFRRLCEDVFGPPAIPEAMALHRAYWDGYLSAMRLDPAAKPLLRRLRSRGLKLGLLTDLTEEIQLQKLTQLGLSRAFDAVVTSEEVGCEKPDPAAFAAILRRLRVAPKQGVIVGDDYWKDIQGGKRMGLQTVWVTPCRSRHRRPAADLVIRSLRGLKTLL